MIKAQTSIPNQCLSIPDGSTDMGSPWVNLALNLLQRKNWRLNGLLHFGYPCYVALWSGG